MPNVDWVNNNTSWPKLKPVIRCAVSSWIELLLVILPKSNHLLGQAPFLILVAGFMSPPRDPFIANLERELINLTLVALSFAWSTLGIKLASLARKEFAYAATIDQIYTGRYVEAVPTIIMTIFLFTGTTFFLWLKARQGPGPYLFATVLACVCGDIALTTASVYPYPTYVGKVIMIPVALHSAIAVTCSILVFPETLNAQFCKRLHAVLAPLLKAIEQQPELLSQCPNSDEFNPKPFMVLVAQSEAALAPTAASARLLKRDVSWGRIGARDWSKLHGITRRLTARANGMAFYFKIIDPTREKFPVTPAPSRPESVINTPSPSRPATPLTSGAEDSPAPSVAPTTVSSMRRKLHSHIPHLQLNLHNSLFRSHAFQDLGRLPSTAVGIFESQKYLNLESHFQHPRADMFMENAMCLLQESSKDLLVASADATRHVMAWLERLNSDRYWKLYGREHAKWSESVKENEEARKRHRKALNKFREQQRQIVINPYRRAFEVKSSAANSPLDEIPPHRYLFQSFLYQYHLLQLALKLGDFLDEINDLERTKRRSRLWMPVLPLRKILSWQKWEPTDHLDHDDDEDPNVIQGIEPTDDNQLGDVRKRNPDSLPPENAIEVVGNVIYLILHPLSNPNVVFGLKGGLLSVILSIPAILPHTARFAYVNHFVWGIIMGQMTINRFRGDTTFVMTARIIATFCGGLAGMIIWYISSGTGKGNPYGIAASMAVCLPFMLFFRLYWPGPMVTNVVLWVTLELVLGYSWQDSRSSSISSQGVGYHVAWKRFVLVTAGTTAAFLFSFLPPSTSLRHYIRMTYATTAAELGQLYCDIVSYASAPWVSDDEQILKSLLAVRAKLNRSKSMRTNVRYELSLRGKWPSDRYEKMLQIQIEIAYLLSHMTSVITHLEPAWAKAFLKRTHFLEASFQADMLAVINMISTAIRTGTPLPQITPCPLLDRFMGQHQNVNLLREDMEDGFGLPSVLNIDTLENEQYLFFSVGVCTAYGVVTRLDRLMLATKELVGEQYHIHGVDLTRNKEALRPQFRD
ncbi:hypothetical protein BD410DRAFT_821614 [Rickenella mellea]|uniref:DUF2421 domain-containing protein n=1 Tax=Rickenella mellea TaxID=50990 RepID=A0A4Y7Q0M8_9AGAM|nr:hypothetical protein BD410DRAFT_821614 [Rickenella mellea]